MDFSNGNGKNNDWGEFLLKQKKPYRCGKA